jgi:hypothetical protein
MLLTTQTKKVIIKKGFMSEERIRINKVLRELNIFERAVDYLKDKGSIEESKHKNSDDVYNVLWSICRTQR